MITTVELTELVDPGDDTIYLTFEFPYLTDAIADEDIVYSILCDNGASVSYNSGNFDSATDIFGNADDTGALDFFEIGQMYRSLLGLVTMSRICHSFVIAMKEAESKRSLYSRFKSSNRRFVFVGDNVKKIAASLILALEC